MKSPIKLSIQQFVKTIPPVVIGLSLGLYFAYRADKVFFSGRPVSQSIILGLFGLLFISATIAFLFVVFDLIFFLIK